MEFVLSTVSPQQTSSAIFQSGAFCRTIPMENSVSHGQPRRFRLHGQAAGGHRPHRRRLRQAAKSPEPRTSPASAPSTAKRRHPFPSTPRASSTTASAAAFPATSSAFIQKIENITFPESVRLVAQKLGIPLPKASYSTPGEAKEARMRGQLLDVHERAVAFFQACLRRPEGARAREYLQGRGLNEELSQASASATPPTPASSSATP